MPLKSANGAVRCCSKNGRTCVTPKSCMETTFAMAQAECSAIEMRICTAEELERNKCCNTGCGFDDKLTWHTDSTSTTTTTTATTTTTITKTTEPKGINFVTQYSFLVKSTKVNV